MPTINRIELRIEKLYKLEFWSIEKLSIPTIPFEYYHKKLIAN